MEAAFAAASAKDAVLPFLVWATLGQARSQAWSLTGTQDGGTAGGAGSEEGTTGAGTRTAGTSEGSRARILPFSKGRGVGVRGRDDLVPLDVGPLSCLLSFYKSFSI